MTKKNGWISGFLYFWKGFSLLTKPGIKRYVIVPLSVNVLIFFTLVISGIHQFHTLVHWFDQWIPHWLQWLNILLWIGFAIAALFVITYTFTIIANLIAAPFNGLLSHKIERLLPHKTPQDQARFSLLKETPRMVRRQLQLLCYAIFCLIIALLLMLIPIIQIPASIIWFFFSSWMLAVQYTDYPMDNHGIDFHQMRQHMANHRSMSLGFGMATNIATLIPLVNFLVMPAAVLGATIMWAHENEENPSR